MDPSIAKQPDTAIVACENTSPEPLAGAPWFTLEPLPALDEILPEHIAYVRSVVARFSVSPSHWRDDLVQEALLEAHRSRDSRLDVRALLSGITRHVVFRWMTRRRAEGAAVPLLPGTEPVTSGGAEDDWREAERRAVVGAAIAALPDLVREVFVRSEIDNVAMPELARELGIPVNTGYTRLHLARASFLASLQRVLARCHVEVWELL